VIRPQAKIMTTCKWRERQNLREREEDPVHTSISDSTLHISVVLCPLHGVLCYSSLSY
jgi:hypothetical protein